MLISYFVEIGFMASLIMNAILFIPQAIKLYRSKNSEHVSLITFLGFNIIQAFIMLHAYFRHDYSLMVGVGLALITCGAVTILTIKYRKTSRS